jgi:hypothetical protein
MVQMEYKVLLDPKARLDLLVLKVRVDLKV